MNYNKVIIAGNMTKDPELRQTQTGKSVCSVSVAINSGYGESAKTAFIECVAFDKTAENIGKYFAKGKPILIEGALNQDTWTDRESGKPRSKLNVIVSRFGFVGGVRDDGLEGYERPRAKRPEAPSDDFEDDDIPF